MVRRSKGFNQVNAAPVQKIHDFHLQNALRDDPNVYSCAIDSFIEIIYHVIFPKLTDISDLTNFVQLLYNSCHFYMNRKMEVTSTGQKDYRSLAMNVRHPIWEYVKYFCPSFRAMDSNAQFSEIFQEHVFGGLNDIEEALLKTTYSYNQECQSCNNVCDGNLSTFIQYFSWDAELDFNICQNWPTVLFSEDYFVPSIICSNCAESIRLTNSYISPAQNLFIELAPNIMNFLLIPEQFQLGNLVYKLSACVRNSERHFSSAVHNLSLNKWQYIDDLSSSSEVYVSFYHLKRDY